MTITFFGHRSFTYSGQIKEAILNNLNDINNEENIIFLLGGYGGFDAFCYALASEYKMNKPCNIKFVTPYIDEKYLVNHLKPIEKNMMK